MPLGIKTLERIARTLSDDVWVVAPETEPERRRPLPDPEPAVRVRRHGERRFSVDGTPTDCVLIGLQRIIEGQPVDLVLSGINHGANWARTSPIPAPWRRPWRPPCSRCRRSPEPGVREPAAHQWPTAERFAPEVIERLLSLPWTPDVLINVNFPDVDPDAVQGVRVASKGTRKIGDTLLERTDPRGEPYFWIGALREDTNPARGPISRPWRRVSSRSRRSIST